MQLYLGIMMLMIDHSTILSKKSIFVSLNRVWSTLKKRWNYFIPLFFLHRYKTDTHEHEEKAFLVNGEKMVIGAYSVKDSNGYYTMTMYTADKDGYRPQVRFGIDESLLKSAVGK